MLWYIYACLFVLGLIIGSFLNVVILRFDTGRSITYGRSKCFSCGKDLTWQELIPLFSFLVQSGKCKGCGTKISWQYPIVELVTGCLFVLTYTLNPIKEFNILQILTYIVTVKILSLYVVMCVYDFRHKIIPDFFSYSAALSALVYIGLTYCSTGVLNPYTLIAGPALFVFFWFFWFISKGTWMGLGDAKLALSVGWFLGLSGGIAAILLSFWIGSVVSLVVMAIQKLMHRGDRLGFKSEIPFGPYILLGFLIVWLSGIDMGAILSILAV